MRVIKIISLHIVFALSLLGKTFYVAPYGDDLNDGSEQYPFKTLQKAIKSVKPGDKVYIREGVYPLKGEFISRGTKEKPIVFEAYPKEKVVFKGNRKKEDKFWIVGSYLILKNFEIINGETGIVFTTYKDYNSSFNILENIDFHDHIFGGVLITGGASHNLILNCDSHDNFDEKTAGEHADGFAVKGFESGYPYPYAGEGNRFVGCRAFNNSDDGFDLWGAGGAVTIERCLSYGNGYDRWNFTKRTGKKFEGDGSGFKLGRNNSFVKGDSHKVINSIAWNNKYAGFDFSENKNSLLLKNNISYNNKINYKFGSNKHILSHNLSIKPKFSHFQGIKNKKFLNSWEECKDKEIEKRVVSYDDTKIRGKRDEKGEFVRGDFLKLNPPCKNYR